MSDWIEALQVACLESSQNKVAKRIGVSGALVSQVLKGKYPGDLCAVEAKVRLGLMNETLECPILGEISKKACFINQDLPFFAGDPQRVQLFKACNRSCKNRKTTR